MHTAVRPLATAGVALLGAGVIAATPVAAPPEAPTPQIHLSELPMPQVQLTASVVDIFTFPAFRQWVVNQIDDLATLGIGLARSAAGLGQSLAAIPSTLVTATQQVLSGDLLAALTTFETYLVGSLVAVGGPTLAAIIERRQRVLAVSEAMQEAVPAALIGLGTGVFAAVDGVLRSSIIAGQSVVDALLPPNLGNLVNALVGGTQLIAGSLVDGGQDIVDAIVFAQKTIATALAAKPAASATAFSAEVTDVPDLSNKAAMVPVSSFDTAAPKRSSIEAAKSVGDQTEPESTGGTPEAKKSKRELTAVDGAPPTAHKTDRETTNSPKAEGGKKSGDSPEQEPRKAGSKKADKDSQAEAAEHK
ncbi:hypothetical protein ACGFK1_27560 [Mycobacterium sp. NPDC048908]|uniref:hypothetical protein n=1 Tax=Mycobacterium sp. NPDC048908 TaxID=3364292 RepID=UPI003716A7CE